MKNLLPSSISLVIFFAVVTAILSFSLKSDNGHLVYALDDAYIHMAMAKNFSNFGVWGVDKTAFSSSSSSPLWTLLLSCCFAFFGVNEIVPFILNILFSIILLFVVDLILKKNRTGISFRIIVLLSIVFFSPLYSLVFTGLEHILHILFVSVLFFVSKEVVVENKNVIKLLPLAFFSVAVRYESLFLIFVIIIFLFLKKRYLSTLLLFVFSLIPVVVYGIISVVNGWNFFPNPVFMKGNFSGLSFGEFTKLINRFIEQAIITPPLTVLIFSAFLLYVVSRKKSFIDDRYLLFLFAASAILHLIFARTGWFFRYEAYLIVLGILSFSSTIYKLIPDISKIWTKASFPQKSLIFISIFIMLFPFLRRGYLGLSTTHKAIKNIYEQQYQMGLFVKKYFSGDAVMLNDIGAVCFLANIKCLDVWGVANHEVMCLKSRETYCSADFERLAKEYDCKVAIVYLDWIDFYAGVPQSWIKVGSWKIKDNVVCARDKVTFFAFDEVGGVNLKSYLSQYQNFLPNDVELTIY